MSNTMASIPPFPSQDLAKLVLGYLAEEQLMTAYDEFLQASPYLDAFKNEYDRIFMTSLRNIVAEYWAVKIFVETCKPFNLRKRIFQCSNLLEIVKLLISLVDLNKLNGLDIFAVKSSSNVSKASKTVFFCGICTTLNSSSCVCKSKSPEKILSKPVSTKLNNLETTPLLDLPGHTVNNNNNNEFENHTSGNIISQSSYRIDNIDMSTILDLNVNVEVENHLPSSTDDTFPHLCSPKVNTDLTDNFENNTKMCIINPVPENRTSNETSKIITAGSFQEFAAGVDVNSKVENLTEIKTKSIIKPSCENKDNKVKISPISNIKGPPKVIKFLPVIDIGNKNKTLETVGKVSNLSLHHNFKNFQIIKSGDTKAEEQKIKILSDVKINSLASNKSMIPPILKTATSTPLLKTRRIFINGTPAYMNKLTTTYTKDEILAMPTIILLPATDPSKTLSGNSNNVESKCSEGEIEKSASTRSLGPLTIDVTHEPMPNQEFFKQSEINTNSNEKVETDLIRTVDPTSSSLPKDANIANQDTTSTPNVLPPARKSSSTPRRNSHIRVLDFATPRRVLNVSNNDIKLNIDNIKESEASNVCLNTVQEESEAMIEKYVNIDIKPTNVSKNKLLKENKTKPIRTSNWDEQLRALAVKNDNEENKCESVCKKKKKPPQKVYNKLVINPNAVKIISNKIKKTKKTRKSMEIIEENENVENKPETAIKPTINVIVNDWPLTSSENKETVEDNAKLTDTPELERLSLQNEIGSKLNISDILDTPYKQVLYDIQMETPRCLGLDLPGDPLSDIKIMNIPTPKFFDQSKATPSSYSSRPTDYSSGGSYYKPDEQDYIPIADVLECALTVTDDTQKDDQKPKLEKCCPETVEKPRRPVRKCTKNVSYRSPSHWSKESNDKCEIVSASSEIIVTDKTIKKPGGSKQTHKNYTSIKNKPETKAGKSVFKKDSVKNFMKIKPRKVTPIKCFIVKDKRKSFNVSSNLHSKKKTNSKERMISDTPMIAVAPTKSRRKSTTPRKLHCSKSFNLGGGDNHSSDKSKSDNVLSSEFKVANTQESDTEQHPLRWSDDGSQDFNTTERQKTLHCLHDSDDITKIKEYIATSVGTVSSHDRERDINDLVKRGFDIETAKIIERDLLDTPPRNIHSTVDEVAENKESKLEINVIDKTQSDDSMDESEDGDVELSVSECCEGNANYIFYSFDETNFISNNSISKIKENYSMDIRVNDDMSIRLRATSLYYGVDLNEMIYDIEETENAVRSISNIEKLYTPIKDAREECFAIFDSTLTSLDTPLKVYSPKEKDYTTITEIVLEVEKIECKDKVETRKRKRISGNVEETVTLSKKNKSETQYLLDSASIQNMDIESVLSKLHGP